MVARIKKCPMCGYDMSVAIEPKVMFRKEHLPRMSHSQHTYCEVLVKVDGVKRQLCRTCVRVTMLGAAAQLLDRD